jgi:hypothetical protein
MISTTIWTSGGIEIDGPTLAPKDINDFIELIKLFGVWIDGNQYKFQGATYHAENKNFDITVE